MRVHNKIGSKERFLEMFENVTKTKIVDKTIKGKKLNEYNKWGLKKTKNRVDEAYEDWGGDATMDGGDIGMQHSGNFEPEEYVEDDVEKAKEYFITSGMGDEADWYNLSSSEIDDVVHDAMSLYGSDDSIPTDESFDNPKEKDHKYLNKGDITIVLKQSKPDDGTRYPVEDKLKVSDPSLEKMKGDDAPIKEIDNQDVDDDEIGGEIEAELGDSPEVGIEPETSTEEIPDNEIGLDTVPDIEGKIEGGLGDEASPSDFDSDQISKGIKVEMEHTDDPKIALEITLDHLTEDPKYYGEGGLDPDISAMDSAQQDVEDSEENMKMGEMPMDSDNPMQNMMQNKMQGGDSVHDSSISSEPEDGQMGMGGMMQGNEPEGDEESEILFGKMGTMGNSGVDEPLEDLEFKFEPKNVGEDFDFAGQETEYYDKKYEEDDAARKEELLAKGEMASPEEKEELAQLLGLSNNDAQMDSKNDFDKIGPSGSV